MARLFEVGLRCKQSIGLLLSAALGALSCEPEAIAQVTGARSSAGPSDKGIYRVQPPQVQVEPVLKLSNNDLAQIAARGSKALELSKGVQEAIMAHLASADNYDVAAFARNDDHLNDLYEQSDANLLDWQILAQAAQLPQEELTKARQQLRLAKQNSYKSSAVFYLCFGQPMQAVQCARLAIAMAQYAKTNTSELRFYEGAAALWTADYDAARPALEAALASNLGDYANYYIGEIYLARKDYKGAIEWLSAARSKVSPAAIGHIDRSLALTYTLLKDPKAAECIARARQELTTSSAQATGAQALIAESRGIVEAIAGQYASAESKLSEAITGLSVSPIKQGNKLEAAQAYLWRSYCRHKLGNKSAAREDRDACMTFIDDANHLAYLARNLDQLFKMENAAFPPSLPPQNRFAVVIGLSNFQDERVPKLRYSTKDASDMATFLKDEAGFAGENIKVMLDSDANAQAILDSIATWLPERVKPGDIVFFFISSHGTPAYGEIGALNSVVAYDTKIDKLFSTSVPMQKILRQVRSNLKKQRTFVVLDTCYSGGLGAPDGSTSDNADPDLMVNSNLQLLLSSSDAKERSWESKRYRNSVFTRQLINELERHLTYKDFHDIFTTVQKDVEIEVASDWHSTQTPRLAGMWQGEGLVSAPSKK